MLRSSQVSLMEKLTTKYLVVSSGSAASWLICVDLPAP
jgi:hypothetical protein